MSSNHSEDRKRFEIKQKWHIRIKLSICNCFIDHQIFSKNKSITYLFQMRVENTHVENESKFIIVGLIRNYCAKRQSVILGIE